MVKRAEVPYRLNKYAVMREEDADENSQDGSSDDDHNSDYSDYNNEDLLAFIGENEAGWEDTQRDGLYFSSSDGSYEEQTESEGDETDFFNSSTSDREA
ncbi:hypothetical protein AGDE_13607 [Angomonas deanei]|nr:hypothetical protein AGDE_13607 [Angomonas deanei]|eukprot:EPY22025.1 hypothetical protein AGDE_13607 [Angomonas deanei]